MRGDVTKLPKWAQIEIGRLTRDLEAVRAQLSAGPEDSDTFADPYSDAPRPLGKGPNIDFCVGARDRLHVRLEDGVLRIQGTQTISIRPQASNFCDIRIEQR